MPLPENTAVCTAVDITGCFTPTPVPKPTLVFQFTHEDGTLLPPIALVLDVHDALSFEVISQVEVARSIDAAYSARRSS